MGASLTSPTRPLCEVDARRASALLEKIAEDNASLSIGGQRDACLPTLRRSLLVSRRQQSSHTCPGRGGGGRGGGLVRLE